MSLELRDITSSSEYASMAAIKVSAFEDNPVSHVTFANVSREAQIRWLVKREELERRDSSQRIRGIYDTSMSETPLVAWVKWHVPISKAQNTNGDLAHQSVPAPAPAEDTAFGLPPMPEGTNEVFNNGFRGALGNMMDKHYDKTSEYVISNLCTHPEYAGRGCASMLLNSVIRDSDELHASTLVQATEAARPLYQKLGWQSIDKIDLDLDKFGGPGQYVLTVMRREPKQATD